MVKHKLMKKRLTIVAKELGVFTTQQMVDKLNNYPNNLGHRVAKSPKICTNRCHNFLSADKKIAVKVKHCKSKNTRTIWEYIGDEEE
tara:strand:+ start:132 stop:392 length:261 start_codon:yes stop_codon:yes gene_type:complete